MGPADGINVLDLSRYGPGRYASMILSDFGADVIAVETPRRGAQLHKTMADDTAERYLAQNRNKKSITLNLTKEEGKKIFLSLAQKADIIIQTYRPGVAKRLGVDYETISKLNPRIIYCSISCWGQDGPHAQRPGHDLNCVGVAGLTWLTGPKNAAPTRIPMSIGDLAGGASQATTGILAALLAREKTGRGQHIDAALTDGLIFYLWTVAQRYFQSGKSPERADSPTGYDSPWMNIYQARDGKWFTVGCFEPWLWENLCRLVGREEFVDAQSANKERQHYVYYEMCKIFLQRDRDVWVDMLDKANVCVGPVYTLEETFADPQVKHRKLVVEVDHPKLGRVKLLNSPYKLSETPGRVRTRPPLYGEHTDEVLKKNMGYGEDDMKRLRSANVIE